MCVFMPCDTVCVNVRAFLCGRTTWASLAWILCPSTLHPRSSGVHSVLHPTRFYDCFEVMVTTLFYDSSKTAVVVAAEKLVGRTNQRRRFCIRMSVMLASTSIQHNVARFALFFRLVFPFLKILRREDLSRAGGYGRISCFARTKPYSTTYGSRVCLIFVWYL